MRDLVIPMLFSGSLGGGVGRLCSVQFFVIDVFLCRIIPFIVFQVFQQHGALACFRL